MQQKKYENIKFILMSNEKSLFGDPELKQYFYGHYWTDQYNAFLETIQKKNIKNVYPMTNNLLTHRHPASKNLVYGDRHHLMTRRTNATLPGSLWADAMMIMNFVCLDKNQTDC